MDKFEFIIALLPFCVTSIIVPILRAASSAAKHRSRVKIIGIVGSEIPLPLAHLEDFTSYRKAVMTGGTVLLHCRTLSYALRHCDFVCAEASTDPKVRSPRDLQFWETVK